MNIVQAFQNPLTVDNRDLIVRRERWCEHLPGTRKRCGGAAESRRRGLVSRQGDGTQSAIVFTPELLQAAAAKFTTEQGLRRAIERGEFELVYQPRSARKRWRRRSVEALIRWRMPDGSLTSPGQFLAIAEESGLIMEISDWVLQSAIEAAAHWHHGAWPEVRVSVNVTSAALSDAGVRRIDCATCFATTA